MSAQPVPVKLYSPLSSRSATIDRDCRLFNGIAEKSQEGDEVWVTRRPCLLNYDGLFPPAGAAPGRGVFNWLNNLYAVFGSTLYRDGAPIGTVNASGIYTFTSCLGATPRLFLKNHAAAYVYDPVGGLVQVTDVDYPAATTIGCVYLNGTTYVLDGVNGIHGSDFNDQQSWDPLNLLLAQITPDPPQAIAKQLVYVVALKQVSMEVFHDAGNATGSPLAPVQGSKSNVGCRAFGTVCDVAGDLCWVGTTSSGSVQIMHMAKVLPRDISTPPVERFLGAANFSPAWSWTAEIPGHRFYVVTLPNSNITLAFDLLQGAWYIWTDTAGNYLPIISSTYDSNALPVLQHATNGRLYSLQPSHLLNTDDGDPVRLTLFTPNWDGGLRTTKTLSTLEVVADQVDVDLDVTWSDDDYQTFTANNTLNLNQPRPMIDDGSSFRSRSWKLTTADNAQVRLKRLEITVQAGVF